MNEGIVIIMILVFAALMILVVIAFSGDAYKQGQIDAINGKIKYKLVEFPDGSREYYQEKELRDLKEHKIIK